MSGIYIHIPFCKQACHYCDFHFSTQMRKKEAMVKALQKEMELRKDEFKNELVETIYFGGGTPSVLTMVEINDLIKTVYANYTVVENPEITLEANPDDLTEDKILELNQSPINRLSIGIQSFFDEDLKLMNRAHSSNEAIQSLSRATRYFKNISIDLIYGIPGMDNKRWQASIDKALSFGLPHISSYALTVEPRTALKKFIEKGIVDAVDDNQAQEQFHILADTLEAHDFVNYEISNFGKEGFFSKNNTSYWKGKKYIGIGPSAHSFDGKRRGWNIRNNIKYIKALQQGELPLEIETLTKKDRYNEYVMTGLRTIWGVSLNRVQEDFGIKYLEYLNQQSEKYIAKHLLFMDGKKLIATKKGKFLVDGIASDLFMINLES
ncbi:radical SAM family heme chaperone HemW [Flagellimonas sp. 389]|uniref:radical SAM family heme chaperone HemW n=1 Tax=Flagellimonas sp. 389 TaxID=2835862 RepID=UPI001BD2F39A|nr:radical SAM family heme chaperone HemW [Flagellimonas sp. 389]MBS9460967.1 radical SAM family heme chaperone HemW [Flagellimonas sp. 389]